MTTEIFRRRLDVIPLDDVAERLEHLMARAPRRQLTPEERQRRSDTQRAIWFARRGEPKRPSRLFQSGKR